MGSDAYNDQFHFVLFPFPAPGHMIPLMDIARMLAQRGLIVTIVTTHENARRFETSIDRATESGMKIKLAMLRFPCEEVGLPPGCENLDMLPGPAMARNLFRGLAMLRQPAEDLFHDLTPRPCCIVSDMCFPWTLDIANKCHVPRVSFTVFSSFFLVCLDKICASDLLETVESASEYFSVPGLPDHIMFTKNQIDVAQSMKNPSETLGQVAIADKASYGTIINSFEELEPAYAQEFKNSKNGKAWCVGPVSLSNNDALDKAQRGNKAAIDESECLEWLDTWSHGSVVYACMGSMLNLAPTEQMMELGLGLEASNKPFIWVIKEGPNGEEMETLLELLEERVKGRGLLIRGWAPQVLILSHPAIGGFLTHCGWNSTLEGICAGVPLITWPFFGDQFGNERLVEKVLRVGVGIGVEVARNWGEEEKKEKVGREDVKRAIERVMDDEEMRTRARSFAEGARRAGEVGGSSYNNLSMLIEDITQMASNKNIVL